MITRIKLKAWNNDFDNYNYVEYPTSNPQEDMDWNKFMYGMRKGILQDMEIVEFMIQE